MLTIWTVNGVWGTDRGAIILYLCTTLFWMIRYRTSRPSKQIYDYQYFSKLRSCLSTGLILVKSLIPKGSIFDYLCATTTLSKYIENEEGEREKCKLCYSHLVFVSNNIFEQFQDKPTNCWLNTYLRFESLQ